MKGEVTYILKETQPDLYKEFVNWFLNEDKELAESRKKSRKQHSIMCFEREWGESHKLYELIRFIEVKFGFEFRHRKLNENCFKIFVSDIPERKMYRNLIEAKKLFVVKTFNEKGNGR